MEEKVEELNNENKELRKQLGEARKTEEFLRGRIASLQARNTYLEECLNNMSKIRY